MSGKKGAGFVCLALVATVAVTVLNAPGNSEGTRAVADSLTATFVATGPTVDGVVDSLWGEAELLVTSNGVTLRALYTVSDLYLLLLWSDPTQDDYRRQWSWAPAAGEWAQASNNEDRVALIWNIGSSMAAFNVDSCQAACHIPANASRSVMATVSPGETLDVWHWKATRTNPDCWADDQWIDDTRLPDSDPLWVTDPYAAREAAHQDDAKTAGGYSHNRQTLNNGVEDVEVPWYWEPGVPEEDARYLIQTELDAGQARRIVSVDAANSLTDEDGTTVPTTATMPGYIVARPLGSRGDITSKATWGADTWTLELKRALDTGFADDVQFDDTRRTAAYAFGVARFDNAGGVSHVSSGSNAYQLMFEEPNLPPSDLQTSLSNDSPAVGEQVSFSAVATDPENDLLEFFWNFGDGYSGTGREVSHTYEGVGLYTVTLIVNDGVNDPVIATMTVEVVEPVESGLDVILLAGFVILFVVVLAIIGYAVAQRRGERG